MAFASSRIEAQEAIIKLCDLCEDDENVNWFCKDCNQNLCDRCKRLHLRSNVSKSHIVLSISEGIAMVKRNLSNICRTHDELFTFFCRTCDRNICSKCLSTKHKKHDFVDLRELASEIQKQLDDVIKEKETEKHTMTKAFDDLVQYESQLQMNLKDECAKIKDGVKAIKSAADEEGEKLEESLHVAKHQQDKEVKEGIHRIQTQLALYDKEIQNVQQELRLQAASSLNDFVKNSIHKLKALMPIAIAIPDKLQLSREEQADRNQIRETIGDLLGTQKVSKTEISNGTDRFKCIVSSELKIIRIFHIGRIKKCSSMCLSPDGSIWIGGVGYVYKMSSDCSTVLHRIPVRETWFSSMSCSYIACLQSDDAIVSYGGSSCVDKFTSDGRKVEFTDIVLRSTFDIAVNNHDEVVIDVDHQSVATFSRERKKLREFKVDGGITALCVDKDRNIIVTHPKSSNLTVLDGRSGEVKTTWEVSMSDIERLTCDRYGNILATNRKKNVCLLSKNGQVKNTFAVDCDGIKGICVNQEDHLLILMFDKGKHKIHVTKYLE